MTDTEKTLKKIASHAKEYGFIFPSSEIYDGLGAVYDYGQNGVELKKNIQTYWWMSMTQFYENIVGLDTAVFMHPKTWKASGHEDAFTDPMIDNKDSKKRYRADVLIEEAMAKWEDKLEKEIQKESKKRAHFDRELFIRTNSRASNYYTKIKNTSTRLKQAMDQADMEALKNMIQDLEITDPISGTRNWTDVRKFNLMFSTQVGAIAEEANKIYLRPETAQGIFVNFLNVQKTARMKIPFGIAQIGKAFRNEVIARQFIFRMREFEQMEMQFFVKPGDEMTWYEYWKDQRLKWHLAMGLKTDQYRYFDHLNLAHYANAACDIQFRFPIGFKELEGIHSRTDFDLKSHEQFSGKKIRYFDAEINSSYIPYVVETSVGLDRIFFAILSAAYREETLPDGTQRVVLVIPYPLAPIKLAILPLVKKDSLPEKAREIMSQLKYSFHCFYEEKDAIGKRYRRQDAIGTPYCLTVDHQTLSDDTVTLRNRDTMKQDRVPVRDIEKIIQDSVSMMSLLKKLPS